MSFSNYLEDKILKHVFGGTAYTAPAAIYVGLFTAAPGETGGGTEVSGNGYARAATGTITVSGTSPTNATNAAAIEFAAASGGNWGTITHAGIFDASTSGNLLAWAALSTSRTINDGDVLRIPAGDLDVTLT